MISMSDPTPLARAIVFLFSVKRKKPNRNPIILYTNVLEHTSSSNYYPRRHMFFLTKRNTTQHPYHRDIPKQVNSIILIDPAHTFLTEVLHFQYSFHNVYSTWICVPCV